MTNEEMLVQEGWYKQSSVLGDVFIKPFPSTTHRQVWAFNFFGWKIERWVRMENVLDDSTDFHWVINGVRK